MIKRELGQGSSTYLCKSSDARGLSNPCPWYLLSFFWHSFSGVQTISCDSQYDRFSKLLRRALALDAIVAAFQESGINTGDIGTHSFRKGGSTYCTSGSTQCPSATAVYLRAGWTIEGVQSRYLRYEAAGDQFVAEPFCGLPIDSAEFAALPPLFRWGNLNVKSAVAKCFPNAPVHLHAILEHTLASVIFHMEFFARHFQQRTASIRVHYFSHQFSSSYLHW